MTGHYGISAFPTDLKLNKPRDTAENGRWINRTGPICNARVASTASQAVTRRSAVRWQANAA
jgi:hypothetical protein